MMVNLSKAEVAALIILANHVGGNPDKTARRLISDVRQKLVDVVDKQGITLDYSGIKVAQEPHLRAVYFINPLTGRWDG